LFFLAGVHARSDQIQMINQDISMVIDATPLPSTA
jgi:hypothetical protein